MKNKDHHIRNFEEKFAETKENNFSVPEGYFEKLPDRISENIVYRNRNASNKTFLLNTSMVVTLAAAAVILLAVGINFNSIRNYFDSSPPAVTAENIQLSDDEIIEELMSAGLREDVLFELAGDVETTLSTNDAAVEQLKIDEYTTDQIDEDLIIEEL